ncbi:hypothetical protein [Thermococcus sp. 21S9]|uniref:hypothetical protein n=1 Tax=Thermococcus sp. 21S9 TaxID=1638223 RepID=UPI00143A13B3|nr:hypothetical protein [Thermococcus sp. 21S9]NJE54943.1 hypothetical protein [Thermococcus sp. 21S9]
MPMKSPFKSRVVILSLVAFAVILALSVGPWWKNLMGDITPTPPNVSAIYLGSVPPGGKWQFTVEDRLLDECAVAYVYNFTPTGVLTVYEIDAGTLKALGFTTNYTECEGSLGYGYLAVNFTQKLDTLSIVVWTSKSSSSGNEVYFVELGSWKFVNGSYIGYIAPPVNKNYMLLDLEAVRKMVNQTGIHYINRR